MDSKLLLLSAVALVNDDDDDDDDNDDDNQWCIDNSQISTNSNSIKQSIIIT